MKKLIPLALLSLLPVLSFAQVVLISEDFETYSNGNLLAQTAGLPWATWANAPGTSEDAQVSNEQASSGSLSAKFFGTAAGGPTDVVLRLGDRTAGAYVLSWNMFITPGFGGYFNLQHNEVIGNGSWMMDVTFLPNGTVQYLVGGNTTSGSFTSGEWFNVSMAISLDMQQGALAIDGTVQHTWMTGVPGPNRLGAVNFFAYAGGAPSVPSYYIDDVLFVDVSSVGIAEQQAMEVGIYPNPTSDVLTVELAGQASAAIASLVDLTGRVVIDGRSFTQNGSVSRTQLDLQGLPAGLYLLRLQDGNRELVRRVTKL